jgi:hypothetical protein
VLERMRAKVLEHREVFAPGANQNTPPPATPAE